MCAECQQYDDAMERGPRPGQVLISGHRPPGCDEAYSIRENCMHDALSRALSKFLLCVCPGFAIGCFVPLLMVCTKNAHKV